MGELKKEGKRKEEELMRVREELRGRKKKVETTFQETKEYLNQ